MGASFLSRNPIGGGRLRPNSEELVDDDPNGGSGDSKSTREAGASLLLGQISDLGYGFSLPFFIVSVGFLFFCCIRGGGGGLNSAAECAVLGGVVCGSGPPWGSRGLDLVIWAAVALAPLREEASGASGRVVGDRIHIPPPSVYGVCSFGGGCVGTGVEDGVFAGAPVLYFLSVFEEGDIVLDWFGGVVALLKVDSVTAPVDVKTEVGAAVRFRWRMALRPFACLLSARLVTDKFGLDVHVGPARVP